MTWQLTGQGRFVRVVYAVTHQVWAAVRGSRSDCLYSSGYAALNGPDTPATLAKPSQALAVGSSYHVTNTVGIPANAPPSCCLIVKADGQNAVFEANGTNIWRAFAGRLKAKG